MRLPVVGNTQVLIDGRVFTNDYQVGIQRYYREILSRAAESDNVDVALYLDAPSQVELPRSTSLHTRSEMFPMRRRDIVGRVFNKFRRR